MADLNDDKDDKKAMDYQNHDNDDHTTPTTASNSSIDDDNNNNNNNQDNKILTMKPSQSIDPTTVTFVDYRRPPNIKVQPPPKYKLWLLVFVLVYFAIWVSELANFYQFLRFRGWLSPSGTEFLQLAIVVFVLVFAGLDTFVALGTIHYGWLLCNKDDNHTSKQKQSKQYTFGIGPWLQSGRIQWIHQIQYADYFVVECLKGMINILEDGFGMFNATQPTTPSIRKPRNTTSKSKKKKTQLKNARRSSSQLSAGSMDQTNNDNDDENDETYEYKDHENHNTNNDDDEGSDDECYKCNSDNCKTVVKIEHRINPDKMNEYENWQRRIRRAAQYAHGLLSLKSMDIIPEETTEEEEEEAEEGNNDNKQEQFTTNENDIEKGQRKRRQTYRHSTTTTLTTTTRSNLHTIYMTFDNIDNLNEWMMSPRRKALMKQLEPLLVVPDQEKIQAERAAIARDAFTNLAIQQGEYSPTLPPKKWKVWWLTTVALVITKRWSDLFLPYYYEFWGLNEKHPRIKTIVSVFIDTFLNSYVLTPFLLFLFNPWMIRRPNEKDERFIWKTLDDGITHLWLKAILTFVYYGGCIIAWIVQTKA